MNLQVTIRTICYVIVTTSKHLIISLMPSSYSTAFWFSLYVPKNYHKGDIKNGSIFFAFEVLDRFLGNHKQLQYIINMEINKRDSDSTPDLSLYIPVRIMLHCWIVVIYMGRNLSRRVPIFLLWGGGLIISWGPQNRLKLKISPL